MVTTESKDEFFMVVIGGQDCYRLGIKEKLKLEMKKSGVVVGELLNTARNGDWFMLELEHEREELSAVSRLTPDLEVEGCAGKTKTEAPELIRNLL